MLMGDCPAGNKRRLSVRLATEPTKKPRRRNAKSIKTNSSMEYFCSENFTLKGRVKTLECDIQKVKSRIYKQTLSLNNTSRKNTSVISGLNDQVKRLEREFKVREKELLNLKGANGAQNCETVRAKKYKGAAKRKGKLIEQLNEEIQAKSRVIKKLQGKLGRRDSREKPLREVPRENEHPQDDSGESVIVRNDSSIEEMSEFEF